jgi:alpha-amylase
MNLPHGVMAAAAILLSCCHVVSPDSAAPIEADLKATPAGLAGWRSQVLYLVMPDRFRNGDPRNDNATNCFNPSNPRWFHGGDFEGLRTNLSYVRELGATAIWVTPPNKQGGRQGDTCAYHGYWIDYANPHDGALQPELGTGDELTRLVNDVHAANMRFVLDVVVNHSGDDARLKQQQPNWFHDEATCSTQGPPVQFCPLDHHPDFKQELPEVADYLSSLQAQAIARFGVDGIRMDTAKHVPPSYFRDSFFPVVGQSSPALFSLAEVFEASSTEPVVPYLDAGFDSAFHFPLQAALTNGIGRSGSVDLIARAVAEGIQTVGAGRALDLVLFIDNHDVPRFANVPGYGVPETEIRKRLMLALNLIFTLPGIPQLYYGDELGMYGAADPDNRRDLPEWATDAAARARRHEGSAVEGADQVFARVQRLSFLKRTVPAFADGEYRELWRQNGAQNPNVFAFSRGAGSDMRIVLTSNGARNSGVMRIPVAGMNNGTVLVDELGDGAPSEVTIIDGKLVVDLPARSAAIYRLGPAAPSHADAVDTRG